LTIGAQGSETLRTIAQNEIVLTLHGDFPLRAGYRYDDGAKSNSISGGLGYINTAFAAELAIRRVVSGDPAPAVVFGFTYHLDYGGLPQGETDSF